MMLQPLFFKKKIANLSDGTPKEQRNFSYYMCIFFNLTGFFYQNKGLQRSQTKAS